MKKGIIVIALLIISICLFGYQDLCSYIPSKSVPSMIYVEGSIFLMGEESKDVSHWSRPVHQVTLTYDFFIGKSELTFEQYDRFCDETGRPKPDDESWGRDRRPVINVTWNDAIAYCNWLSDTEGLPRAYDDSGNLIDADGNRTTNPSLVVGYRLPTEAEWEFAARGGAISEGFKFAGSDIFEAVSWFLDNSGGTTHEIAMKLPNELGLYDMSGNVWEWCSDSLSGYGLVPRVDPFSSAAQAKVIRGGSFNSEAGQTLIGSRQPMLPFRSSSDIGFRIARTSLQEVSEQFVMPETVLVESGTFFMGDTWGEHGGNELPVHQVVITYDFYMGRYLVTFDEFDWFCRETERAMIYDWNGYGRGKKPVYNATWFDAIAFCNWLSDQEGLPRSYDSEGNFLDRKGELTNDPSEVVGYRLPTEAEWEYAARGGIYQSPYRYSGSDNADEVAWHSGNADRQTHEVGQKLPNALGIYDMSGNVWEWCSDYYADYTSSDKINPYVSDGTARVFRGGSVGHWLLLSRVSFRSSGRGVSGILTGFRIARTAQ